MANLQIRGLSCTAPDDADCIIVQSCGFIESAKQESVNAVIELRARYPEKKIVLAGCLARRYETDLRKVLNEADAVFGESDLSRLANLITENTGKTVSPAEMPAGERPLLSLPGSAYIKIAEGCDNRCSFCAIPLMRGRLSSRPVGEVIGEFARLIQRGIKEFCLIAQDTASYGMDITGKTILSDLLNEFLKIDSEFWIRLLYLHPDHFPLDILPLIRSDNRILPYFDIPFQHASKRLLSLMGRRGWDEPYLELLAAIRSSLPNAVLRSTFLTGFPGETDEDFDVLCRFQKEARLTWAGVFAYSREEGTPAYSMPSRPSKKKAAQRKAHLENTQIPLTTAYLDTLTGKTLDILIEEEIDNEERLYLGRGYLHAPEVDGAAVIETNRQLTLGSLVRVTIKGRAGVDLRCVC